MTRDTPFDERITTSEEFSDTLHALLQAAQANGVDVSGAWESRSNGAHPDWEAVITELAKATGEGGAAGE